MYDVRGHKSGPFLACPLAGLGVSHDNPPVLLFSSKRPIPFPHSPHSLALVPDRLKMKSRHDWPPLFWDKKPLIRDIGFRCRLELPIRRTATGRPGTWPDRARPLPIRSVKACL